MIFIKHLSIKRMRSLYNHDSCKWLTLAGWAFREIWSSREVQNYISVHYKELMEVKQKVTLPFPSKQGLGFARSSKRWHTPVHFQRNLAALMPLKSACLNARQMLAMPSVYPPKNSAYLSEQAATQLLHTREDQQHHLGNHSTSAALRPWGSL